MNILAINGSPRKKWNTATLLEKALEGAAAQGATTELVHLYDLDYKGCTSCFACKMIDGPSEAAAARCRTNCGRCWNNRDRGRRPDSGLADLLRLHERRDALLYGAFALCAADLQPAAPFGLPAHH